MRLCGFVVALITALTVCVVGATAAGLPGAVTFGGVQHRGQTPLVRPGTILYTGDSSGFFAGNGRAGRRPKPGRLTWTSWTATAAEGSGSDFVNNCLPDCADGSYSKRPVTLRLYRPRKLAGFEVFTRMTVHYTRSPSPLTHKRVDTFKVQSSGRHQLFWQFPA